MMQAKVHKAKLITLHSKISDSEPADLDESEPAGIHAYMSLLRNLIRKNQYNLKAINDLTPHKTSKKDSNPSGRRSAKVSLAPLNESCQPTRKASKGSSNNRRQILSTIIQSSRNLIEANSLTKLEQYNGRGNQSERVVNGREEEYKSFVPIGKIYHQLKHRTETAVQNEAKIHMNYSSNLKIQMNKLDERKKFSIYAKLSRSTQRSAFRQNRAVIERKADTNAKGFLRINSLSTGDNETSHSRSPTPW